MHTQLDTQSQLLHRQHSAPYAAQCENEHSLMRTAVSRYRITGYGQTEKCVPYLPQILGNHNFLLYFS